VEVDWAGYELHPETPPGGVPLSEVLPDAEGMLGYVRSFAAGFGITDLVPPRRLPSTRRAHAVAQLARGEGRLEAFREAAFDAYWRRGRGLESDDDLAALARTVGLDPRAAVAAAADPALLARVDAARREAAAAGVSGIPTFEVGESRIVGCQRYEVLADAARRAGAKRRG
jgi:predicted DsbA family dithiol-disulfide isomerase